LGQQQGEIGPDETGATSYQDPHRASATFLRTHS
jgi:hypothetical protein